MAQLTEYGKSVKKALIDKGENQSWLIDRVREHTDLFVDNGYLYKILTGERAAPKVVAIINEILDLSPGIDETRDGDAV